MGFASHSLNVRKGEEEENDELLPTCVVNEVQLHFWLLYFTKLTPQTTAQLLISCCSVLAPIFPPPVILCVRLLHRLQEQGWKPMMQTFTFLSIHLSRIAAASARSFKLFSFLLQLTLTGLRTQKEVLDLSIQTNFLNEPNF